MKLAFADVYQYVGDPRSMKVTPAQMLDDAYLAERARRIDMKRAQAMTAGTPPRGGTVYLTTADASGMMVSFIQSNYMGFGSGVVVPGYGISLQNRGAGFSLDPDSPNCVAPGRRPFQTIIPAFLMQDAQPAMSFGVMGGNMQPQGHVQTLLRMLLKQQQPQAACDAPRWRVMHGLDIEVESAHGPGGRRRTRRARPPDHAVEGQLHGLRVRAVHLAPWATRRSRATLPPATLAGMAWRPVSSGGDAGRARAIVARAQTAHTWRRAPRRRAPRLRGFWDNPPTRTKGQGTQP